jgi:hypothetical protein
VSAEDQLDVAKGYEDGKHRRYSLLFAVNGGAFAVAKLLADKAGGDVVGDLRLEHLALGMVLFTTVMGVDIDAFGRRMKKHDRELYKAIGVFVLLAIGSLIVAGWMLVGSAAASAVLAVIAHVGIILSCHFILPRLEKASPDRSTPTGTGN